MIIDYNIDVIGKPVLEDSLMQIDFSSPLNWHARVMFHVLLTLLWIASRFVISVEIDTIDSYTHG